MVIKGIQTHIVFVFFWFFNFFIYFYMKNKIKQNWKITKQKHVKQNKAMHKTRLTQNNKAKHTRMQKQKQEGEREKKWQNHLEPFCFYTLEEHLCLANPWSIGEGEELKQFKFERNMRVLKRSPRGAKEDGNWFWSLDAIMLLLFWVANYL